MNRLDMNCTSQVVESIVLPIVPLPFSFSTQPSIFQTQMLILAQTSIKSKSVQNLNEYISDEEMGQGGRLRRVLRVALLLAGRHQQNRNRTGSGLQHLLYYLICSHPTTLFRLLVLLLSLSHRFFSSVTTSSFSHDLTPVQLSGAVNAG